MMDEREFEDAIRRHNDPPPTPRERMWTRIDAARAGRRGVVQPEFRRTPNPWLRVGRLAGALAAVLVLGFAIGRWTGPTVPGSGDGPALTAASDDRPPKIDRPASDERTLTVSNPELQRQIYRQVATQLFGRADFLLTDFKVSACSDRDVAEGSTWARGLLTQTQLLLDSPAADDIEMRKLLEELELVLAQINALSRTDCRKDMNWIRDGLDKRDTIDRLRLMSTGGRVARAL